MKNKQNYLNYIGEVVKLIEPLEVSSESLKKLEKEIENTELIVPVVGGFSAGKSSLINSFLEKDILAVAVTPETALATELRYSTDSHIEAVSSDGEVVRYELDEFSAVKDKAAEISYLRVYFDSARLKAIQPLVLVDMPGFDSPLEGHNHAIFSYLNRGVYFVVVTSVEDGTISNSMRREIENLQGFGKGFTFCISKTNLRAEEDVAGVKEQISDQLQDFFDYNQSLVLLNQDGGDNLKDILASINPDSLIELLYSARLKDIFFKLEESINIKVATFRGAKEDAEKALIALQAGIQKVVDNKNSAISGLENRYSNQMVSIVADKVSSELMASKDHLVDLAMNDQQLFSREVNEIVKNGLLVSTQEQLGVVGREVITELRIELQTDLAGGTILDESFLERVGNATEGLLNLAHGGLLDITDELHEKKKEAAKNVYRAVITVAAITTSIVAPVVELVILFLPDIISIFTKNAQKNRLLEQRKEIERQIVSRVIPEVRAKIKSTLPIEFNKQVAVLIEGISEQFEMQLKEKEEEVSHAMLEKEQLTSEIEEEIVRLGNSKRTLLEVAKKYSILV